MKLISSDLESISELQNRMMMNQPSSPQQISLIIEEKSVITVEDNWETK